MNRLYSKLAGDQSLPPRPGMRQILNGLVGGTIGIAVIAYLTSAFGMPLMMAPLGATCVLLFAVPDTPLAQPRNVIGGHFIASLIGILFVKFVGVSPLCMGLAVGVAIALMQLTRTLHAPAGANPLVVMTATAVGWDFLLTPVLAGSVILVLIALVVNNYGATRSWPRYW